MIDIFCLTFFMIVALGLLLQIVSKRTYLMVFHVNGRYINVTKTTRLPLSYGMIENAVKAIQEEGFQNPILINIKRIPGKPKGV